jgi:hypothetical protein
MFSRGAVAQSGDGLGPCDISPENVASNVQRIALMVAR